MGIKAHAASRAMLSGAACCLALAIVQLFYLAGSIASRCFDSSIYYFLIKTKSSDGNAGLLPEWESTYRGRRYAGTCRDTSPAWSPIFDNVDVKRSDLQRDDVKYCRIVEEKSPSEQPGAIVSPVKLMPPDVMETASMRVLAWTVFQGTFGIAGGARLFVDAALALMVLIAALIGARASGRGGVRMLLRSPLIASLLALSLVATYLSGGYGAFHWVSWQISLAGPFHLIIFAPLVEEVVYRKYTFEFVERTVGEIPAMISVSATFALAHQYQIAPAFGLFAFAMVLQAIFIRTRSVGVCVVFHALRNAIGFI